MTTNLIDITDTDTDLDALIFARALETSNTGYRIIQGIPVRIATLATCNGVAPKRVYEVLGYTFYGDATAAAEYALS